MTILYVLASNERSDYISRRAQLSMCRAPDVRIIQLHEANRLNRLFALINARVSTIDHAYFAIDGRDCCAISDFNAFMYALRMQERLNDEYPVVVRSINII